MEWREGGKRATHVYDNTSFGRREREVIDEGNINTKHKHTCHSSSELATTVELNNILNGDLFGGTLHRVFLP